MNANITTGTLTAVELVSEARDWASDCVHMVGSRMGVEAAMRYVGTYYPGGWEGFVQDIGTYTIIR